MPFVKNNPLYKIFTFLSVKRKKELYILFFLLIVNGFLESFSIAIIVPFISIIASNTEPNKIRLFGNFFNFVGLIDTSKAFLIITILFSIFISLSTFFRLFNTHYIIKLSTNLEIELGRLIFKNNIYQSYIKYTMKSSSSVIDITVDKVVATASALNAFLTLLSSIILGIFIVGSLFILNWKIVSVGIILLVFYYLIIIKRIKTKLSFNGKLLADLGPSRVRLLQEVFFGFRDVRVNGNEDIYVDMFNKMDSAIKLMTANSQFISIFPRFFIEGLIVVILIISGYRISLLNVELTTLLPLFGSFIYSIQKLLPLIQQVYSTWANYRLRYKSICEVVEELENNNNSKKVPIKNRNIEFKKSIIFENIEFSYDNNSSILENLSLKINRGDHIGIYGETGSGKSTFLDILLGLLPPSNGEILIDEVNLHEKKLSYEWTSKIAHVSQNIFLKEGTIAENIAYGKPLEKINFDLLIKAAKTAHIYNFVKKTNDGFYTHVGERGIRLSGGQRQRIAIARALYNSKDILVLDEATSALDHITEEKIINSIKKRRNLTIFMVTHRLKSLKICDRVFKVENKKIIEEKLNRE